MPEVQYPHCMPCVSQNASWMTERLTGSVAPSIPSIVVSPSTPWIVVSPSTPSMVVIA